MSKHYLKKRIAGLLTAFLALSIPLQSFGATMTGMKASSAYMTQTGQTAQTDSASSAEVLKQLRETPAFDAAFYAATYQDAAAAFGRNAAALENHYRSMGIYEGRMANAGDLSAWKLRNMRRIRRFLDANAAWYLAHFLDADFPWFHADTYLQKYPEVRNIIRQEYEAAGAVPTEAQYREGAMKHYLDRGALEGNSSCSAFDPVWALVADPDIADPAKPGLTPADVYAAYQARSGRTGTQDLSVGIPEGILQLVTAAAGSGSRSSAGTSGSGGGGSDSGSDDSGSGKAKDDPKEKKNPDHAFLMYLCGSDLESDSREGTGTLFQVLYGINQTSKDQADRMNFLICAGGTKNWRNTYLHSYLNDQKQNTAIYAPDYDEITKRFRELQNGTADLPISSKQQKELFQPVSKENPDLLLFNCFDTLDNEKNWTALADYIINEKTLPLYKEQLTTGSRSMSEGPVLNSFLETAKKTQADQYSLFFWDHGGGLPGGVCQDDSLTTSKILHFEDIRSALENQDLKCSLIGLDACMMGTLEGAYYLKDWCDYIASTEEASVRDFAYEDLIKYIAGHLDSPDTLAKDAALKIVEDRYRRYHGDASAPQTAVAIDIGKAQNAAEELNQLSKALYEFAENKDLPDKVREERRSIVYESILQARLRSHYFGIDSKGKRDGFDYVDAGNFLTLLENELKIRQKSSADAETAEFLNSILDKNSGSLSKTLQAVNDLSLANYAAWNDNFFFVNGLAEDDEEGNRTLGNFKKDIWLCGMTLYIPYFNNSNLKEFRDPKENPWNSDLSLLFGDKSYYRKLIDAYTDQFIYLLPSTEGDKHQAQEEQRISNLKKELKAGRKLQLGEDGKPLKDKDGFDLYVEGDEGKVPSYADILSVAWQEGPASGKNEEENILLIKIDPDAYEKLKPSGNSSNDPYLDLLDTLDTMTTFVTRCVEAVRRNAKDGEDPNVQLDLVIGTKSVTYNSIDGVDSAIKIFGSTLENITCTRVNGTGSDGSKTYTQYVLPYHEVTDFDGDMVNLLNTLFGVDKNRDTSEYTVLRGSVTLKDGSASPEDVCLVFGKDKNDKQVYLGAAERYMNPAGSKDAYGYRTIKGTITEITFSHMVIDKGSNGHDTVKYADGIYDLSSFVVPYTVSQAIYLASGEAKPEELPGSADQNTFHFGLTPELGVEDTFIVPGSVVVGSGEAATQTGEVIKELPAKDTAADPNTSGTESQPASGTSAASHAVSANTDQEPETGTIENAEAADEVAGLSGDENNSDPAAAGNEGGYDNATVSEGTGSDDGTASSEDEGSSVTENGGSDENTVSEGGDSAGAAASSGDDSSDTTVSRDGDVSDTAVSEGGDVPDTNDSEDGDTAEETGSDTTENAAENTDTADTAGAESADSDAEVSGASESAEAA